MATSILDTIIKQYTSITGTEITDISYELRAGLLTFIVNGLMFDVIITDAKLANPRTRWLPIKKVIIANTPKRKPEPTLVEPTLVEATMAQEAPKQLVLQQPTELEQVELKFEMFLQDEVQEELVVIEPLSFETVIPVFTDTPTLTFAPVLTEEEKFQAYKASNQASTPTLNLH